MADNYTYFAEVFAIPSAAAYYAAALDQLVDDSEDRTWPETVNVNGTDLRVDANMKADVAAILEDCGGEWWGTDAAFHPDEGGLYIGADSGDVMAVAAILRATVKRFRITEPLSLEWAATCSRLRAGEFGGGAFVIAGEREWWRHSSELLVEVERQLALDAAFQSA